MMYSGKIGEILKDKGVMVWTILPDATVFEAIQMMAEKNVGALLVTTREGKLTGMISERDYTRKVAIKGRSSKELKVREILSTKVVHATPEHTVEECLRLMTEHRIRHLPVLDGESIAGVISIGDLVNWIIRSQEQTINHLHNYITGAYPA